MFKSYLMVSFRNLLKQKTYTLINCFGLAITLTVCIFIFLFIRNETSYDSQYKDAEYIYRVIGQIDNNYWGRVSLPIGELKKNYSEISSYSRLFEDNGIIKQGENEIKEKLTFVDPGFINVFSLSFVWGDKHTALTDPNSVVLSKAISQKLFGNVSPVGKEILIQLGKKLKPFLITGVTDKIPGNSSINYKILIPFSRVVETPMGHYANRDWGISNLDASLFIKFKGNISKDQIQNSINKYMTGILAPQLSGKLKFIFQPLQKIHLSTQVIYSIQPSSDPVYSYILAGIGFLILVLASINFINLTIMRSSHRFKEIGVRKIIGASRKKIFSQFMVEAFVLTFISLLIAFMLTDLLLPVFNNLTSKNLILNYYNNPVITGEILLLSIFLALITGYYPAVFMSKFNAANVLRGNQKLSGKKSLSRFMIIFQFFASVSLLICTVIMSNQFSYIQNKNLGFDKENIVVLENDILNNPSFYKVFKNELLKYSSIKSISYSNEMPGNNLPYRWNFDWSNNNLSANMFFVGPDYLKTLNIKLKEGRDFSNRISSDTINSVIVNDAFVEALNIKDPVGSTLTTNLFGGKSLKIIGVAKNYNFSSLKFKVEPAVLSAVKMAFKKYIIIKLAKGNLISSMNLIENKWNVLSKSVPFSYTFLDDHLNSLYQSEKRWNDIIKYSGIFAIMIALLGLFGLTSYSVEKRIKEIGIRKILGANNLSIIKMFIAEFSLLVLIANLIAWPVVWYYGNYWLQSFAYRTEIHIATFIAVSMVIMLSTLLLISIQVYKTANTNPVKTLKYE